MINTLKELRYKESLENLDKLYDESLGKTPEEIKKIYSSYGVEVSDACAKECYEFCKGCAEINEKELANVAGGYGHPSIPGNIRVHLDLAIKILSRTDRFKSELIKIAAQNCVTSLKALMDQQFDREKYKNGLLEIVLEIGIFSLSDLNIKVALSNIQAAQRELNN